MNSIYALAKSVYHHAVVVNSLLLVTNLRALLVAVVQGRAVCSAYLGSEVESEV